MCKQMTYDFITKQFCIKENNKQSYNIWFKYIYNKFILYIYKHK